MPRYADDAHIHISGLGKRTRPHCDVRMSSHTTSCALRGADDRPRRAGAADAGQRRPLERAGLAELVGGVIVEPPRVSRGTLTPPSNTPPVISTPFARGGARRPIGQMESCFDKAPRKHPSRSLEWEMLSRSAFRAMPPAAAVVFDWCRNVHNHERPRALTRQPRDRRRRAGAATGYG